MRDFYRMKNRFFGFYKSTEDIWHDFFDHENLSPDDFPENNQILFAASIDENYDATSLVLFIKHGALWINEVSHCSCNDFKGQWNPTKVSWFQLWKENHPLLAYSESTETSEAWKHLIGHNCIVPVDITGETDDEITLSRNTRGIGPEKLFVLVPNALIAQIGPEERKL